MVITKEFLQREIDHLSRQLGDAKLQVTTIEASLATLSYIMNKLLEPEVVNITLDDLTGVVHNG